MRTQINATTVTRAGVAPVAGTATDTANGNYVVNDGSTWLEVENTDAAAHTLTISLSATVDGQPVTARTYDMAAADKLKIGPFSRRDYGAHLQIDADSNLVTVAAYRV